MKKALGLIGVLLVLAAAIALTMRRAGSLGEKLPASRAAELAPAETVAYLEMPDLDRTLARWENGELGAIARDEVWQTQAWQDYAKKWELIDSRNSLAALGLRLFPELKRARPAGFFLAATTIDRRPLPKLVAGISFRGKKTDLEGAVRLVKNFLFARWAGAKSELSTHCGVEIESITNPRKPAQASLSNRSMPYTFALRGASVPPKPAPEPASPPGAVYLAYRDDWLFLATDRALLTGTIDRYLRQPDAPPSLAKNPDFAECRKHAAPDADLVAWERWAGPGESLVSDWPLVSALWSDAENPLRSLHYSVRLDGPVRDRLYLQMARAPQASPLANRSRALIPAEALGCAVVNFDALRNFEHWLQVEFSSNPQWIRFAVVLAGEKFARNDLWRAFGPEAAFIFLPYEKEAWPNLVVAVEVRDETAARRFAEALAEQSGAVGKSTDAGLRFEKSGVSVWDSAAAPKPSFPGPMVLTKRHLIFGTSRHGVDEAAQRSIHGATPGTVSAVVAHYLPQNGGYCYFDTGSFWEEAVLPIPGFVEAHFLSPWEVPPPSARDAVRRHLQPGTIALRTEGPGWVVESNLSVLGTLLFTQLLGHGH